MANLTAKTKNYGQMKLITKLHSDETLDIPIFFFYG